MVLDKFLAPNAKNHHTPINGKRRLHLNIMLAIPLVWATFVLGYVYFFADDSVFLSIAKLVNQRFDPVVLMNFNELAAAGHSEIATAYALSAYIWRAYFLIMPLLAVMICRAYPREESTPLKAYLAAVFLVLISGWILFFDTTLLMSSTRRGFHPDPISFFIVSFFPGTSAFAVFLTYKGRTARA